MRPGRTYFVRAAVLGVMALAVACGARVRAEESTGSTLPQLVLIKAGTRVGEAPPDGWSDLILRSKPEIETGDVESLPGFAASTASLFRTVIMADVRREAGSGRGYALRRVGLCLCVPVKGTDTVVTTKTVSSPSLSLGFVEKEVFARADEELKKARLVSRTGTFAVLAAPSELKVGKAHKKVFLVYAMLVDPKTGRLDTLVWSVAARPDRRTPPASLNRLAPRLDYQCDLDVRAERLLGTVPVSWSFAMCSLPPGEPVATPERLRPWLTDLDTIAARPDEFERLLRQEVGDGTTAPRHPSTAR